MPADCMVKEQECPQITQITQIRVRNIWALLQLKRQTEVWVRETEPQIWHGPSSFNLCNLCNLWVSLLLLLPFFSTDTRQRVVFEFFEDAFAAEFGLQYDL